MRVLKIELEGITTSFRYPHFMVGVHPSFPMPPPATIYGHVCSALGEWVSPDGLQFAYHFTSEGAVEDLEHIFILSPEGGKLPGTTLPKVLGGSMNPFKRQILFHPRLMLYLNRPEWESAFRSPRYPVVLGRSQDLCTYTHVSVVDLLSTDAVYLEHTLLPYEMATRTGMGIVTLMPRWLDYERNRRPSFARYLILQRRVMNGELLRFAEGSAGSVTRYWADPTAPQVKGMPLGLVFHSFTGDDHETLSLAQSSR